MPELNTSFSGMSWLQPQRMPGEAFTSGVQAGNLLSQAMLHQQELKQRETQFNAMLPIRQAEAAYDLQRKTLELTAHMDKMQFDLEQRRGFTELGRVISNVDEYPEKWLDPNFQKDFWQTAAEHPEVAKHPAFDNVIANFPLAERLNERKQQAESELALKQQALVEKTLASEAEQDMKALKIEADLEKAAMGASNKQQGVVDTVTNRQRENWIANRASRLMKEDKKLSREEAFRQARAERNIASGAQYLSSAERRAAEGTTASPTATAATGPARPLTLEQYNALPSGTVYVHPTTGKAKVKP